MRPACLLSNSLWGRCLLLVLAIIIHARLEAQEGYYNSSGVFTLLGAGQNSGTRNVGPNPQPNDATFVGTTLLPFGPAAGDTQLGRSDDASVRFEFFGLGPAGSTPGLAINNTIHTSMWVNNNGLLSFVNAATAYSSAAFPSSSFPIVAGFWGDVDTQPATSGGVWHRFVRDEATLASIGGRLQEALGSPYDPIFASITTWDHVGYYFNKTDRLNTFQIVTATDGVSSYALLLYPPKGIWWDYGSASGQVFAQAGFDAGDLVNFTALPGSRTAAMRDLWFLSSRIGGRPGTHAVLLSGGTRPTLSISSDTTVPGSAPMIASTVNVGSPGSSTPLGPTLYLSAGSLQFEKLQFADPSARLRVMGSSVMLQLGMSPAVMLANGVGAITHGDLILDVSTVLVARRTGSVSGGSITLRQGSQIQVWREHATSALALAFSAPSTLGPGGTFDLRALSSGVGPLSSTGTAGLITSSVSGPGHSLTIQSATDAVFGGTVRNGSSVLSLVKTGVGRQTLAGDNSYTGSTTIQGGSLIITSSLPAGGGTVTVASGGNLGGTGTVSRAIVLNDGGGIAPGTPDTIGTLSGTKVTCNGNTRLSARLGAPGTADRLALSGALTKGAAGKLELVLTRTAAANASATYTLATFSSTTLTAADITVTGLPVGSRAEVVLGASQLDVQLSLGPVITSANSASASFATPFSYTITADYDPTSFTASGLPPGLSLNPATGQITGAPTAVGSFEVTLGATNASGPGVPFTLSLTVSTVPVTIQLSNLSQTYTGSGRVPTVTTSPPGVEVSITYDGGPVAPSAVGAYRLYVTSANPNYIGAASGTLLINRAAALIQLAGLAQTYTGALRTVTVATVPAGLPVAVTYNGLPDAPRDAGSYTVQATVDTENYVGIAQQTLVVSQAAQTIDFPAIADRVYTPGSITLTATATSGLPVAFTLVGGPASLSGATLSPTGAGLVTVRASQPGNTNYLPASAVGRSFSLTAGFATWQSDYFSAAELSVAATSGPLADPDQDGLPNLIEYALGRHPRTADAGAILVIGRQADAWTASYTRPSDRSDLTYVVEVSTSLGAWSTVGVTHEQVSALSGQETWRASYTTSGEPRLFFRLKATRD